MVLATGSVSLWRGGASPSSSRGATLVVASKTRHLDRRGQLSESLSERCVCWSASLESGAHRG